MKLALGILVAQLIVVTAVVMPIWPYSLDFTWAPAGVAGAAMVIVVVLSIGTGQ